MHSRHTGAVHEATVNRSNNYYNFPCAFTGSLNPSHNTRGTLCEKRWSKRSESGEPPGALPDTRAALPDSRLTTIESRSPLGCLLLQPNTNEPFT